MKKTIVVLAVAVVVALGVGTARLAAQKGPELFQRALAVEKADGNLNEAIKLFEQAIKEAGSDRQLAARAWLRIGECYQKLGDKQAQAAFERVIRDFSNHSSEVAEARTRLERITAANGAAEIDSHWARRLSSIEGGITFATLGVDGRLGGTDWRNGDLVLRETNGQITRLVSGGPRGSAWGESPLLSPDRRQIVYGWYNGALPGFGHELRLIANERGARPRVLLSAYPRLTNPAPSAWSNDGRSILVGFELPVPPDSGRRAGNGDFQLAWVSVADGSVRPIRTFDAWRGAANRNSLGRISLSPDNRFIAYEAGTVRGSRDRSIFVIRADGTGAETEVVKGGLNNDPVWRPDGRALLFVSDRAGSFGIWSVPMQDGRAAGVVEAVRLDTGSVELQGVTASNVLHYTHRSVDSQILIADFTPAGRLSGNELKVTESIVGSVPAWSWDGNWLALKRSRSADRRDLIVRSMQSGAEQVFSSADPMGPRTSLWYPDGSVRAIANSTFRVAREGNEFRAAAAGHALPFGAVTSDGRTLYAVSGSASIGVYDVASGDLRASIPIPQSAGQVALSSDGRMLAVITTETPERIAIVGTDGTGYHTLAPTEVGALGFTWTADGSALLFVESSGPRNRLMRLPIAGGAAESVGIEPLNGFDVTRDGRRIAIGRHSESGEVWTMELSSVSQP